MIHIINKPLLIIINIGKSIPDNSVAYWVGAIIALLLLIYLLYALVNPHKF
jgi:K+-transporting ATPase KdpF subunit